MWENRTTEGSLRLLPDSPARLPHQIAEVPATETRVLVGHYIGQTGALGGFRTVLEAVVKGLQEAFRELWRTRINCLDSAPLRGSEDPCACLPRQPNSKRAWSAETANRFRYRE